MTEEEIQHLNEKIKNLSDDPVFMATLKEKLHRKEEEDFAKAPKCFCGDRCDPPFGDGKMCHICRAKPTAQDMQIIVY